MTMDEPEHIAFHEAGHAVVAWSFGWRLTVATICSPNTQEGGYVHILPPRLASTRHEATRLRAARQLGTERMCIYLAGQAAVRRHTEGQCRASMASADYEKAISMVGLLASDPPQEALMWAALEREADNRLTAHWSTVEALAGMLLDQQTLTARALRQFFRQCEETRQAERPTVEITDAEVKAHQAERRAMLLSLLPHHVRAALHHQGGAERDPRFRLH